MIRARELRVLSLPLILLFAQLSTADESPDDSLADKNYSQVPESFEHRRVVIITDWADRRTAMLRESLAAHLSDYAADVEVINLCMMPEGVHDQAQTVEQVLRRYGADGGLWINHRRGIMMVMVLPNDNDTEEELFPLVMERTLPESTDADWQVNCEAIASFVRATLEPWLVQKNEQATDDETILATASVETGNVAPVEKRLWERIALFSRFGFQLNAISFSGRLQVGAHLEFDLVVFNYLQFQAEMDILSRSQVTSFGERFELNHIPRRLGIGLRIPVKTLAFTFKTSILTNRLILNGPFADSDRESSNHVLRGCTTALSAMLTLRDWIEIWAEIGSDFYTESYEYRFSGNSELYFDNVQGHFSLGFALVIPNAD